MLRKIYICTYACAYMVKIISLSEEAYKRLKAIKKDKSFSEIVIEIVPEKRKNIMDLAGIFENNSKEWEHIEKQIYLDRKKNKLRNYKW